MGLKGEACHPMTALRGRSTLIDTVAVDGFERH
jgi:hypothetical protein